MNADWSAIHEAMLLRFFNPHVQACLTAIERIAGYRLPKDARAPFLRYHGFITSEPPPKFISVWRSDSGSERWYQRHVNALLTHTQNALAAAYYRRDALVTLESEVREALSPVDFLQLLGSPDQTIGLGNTLRLDFEYHDFVVALRRTLDFLARGLAAYFKMDQTSFNHLGRTLQSTGIKPAMVAENLFRIYEQQRPDFEYVLSTGDRRSIRDRIVHYEHVGAGTVNLTPRGLILAGGGEDLRPVAPPGTSPRLSDAVNRRLSNLDRCIATLLDGFVASAREAES